MIPTCPFCYCSLIPVENHSYLQCPKCPNDFTFACNQGQIRTFRFVQDNYLIHIHPKVHKQTKMDKRFNITELKTYLYSLHNGAIHFSKPAKLYLYQTNNGAINVSKPPLFKGPAPLIINQHIIKKKLTQLINLKAFL